MYCDGNLVAELQKGRFVALSVPPGSHEIKVSGKQETFAFEPGTSDYVRASQEGFTRWSPFNLRLVDATAGAAEFKDKSITSNEARRTFTNQCAAPQGKRK